MRVTFRFFACIESYFPREHRLAHVPYAASGHDASRLENISLFGCRGKGQPVILLIRNLSKRKAEEQGSVTGRRCISLRFCMSSMRLRGCAHVSQFQKYLCTCMVLKRVTSAKG